MKLDVEGLLNWLMVVMLTLHIFYHRDEQSSADAEQVRAVAPFSLTHRFQEPSPALP